MRIETLLNPTLDSFIVNYKTSIETLKKIVAVNDKNLQFLTLLVDCYYNMFVYYKNRGNLSEISLSVFNEAIHYSTELQKKSPNDEKNLQKVLLFFPIQDARLEELKSRKRKTTRAKKDPKKQRRATNDFIASELLLNKEITNKIVINIHNILKSFKSKHYSMNNIHSLEHEKITIDAYENTQQALAQTLRYIQLKYFVHGCSSDNVVINENEFTIEIKGATLKTFDKNFYAIHPELNSIISSHTIILSTLQKHNNSPATSEIDDQKQQLAELSRENMAVLGLEMLGDIETTSFSISINPRNP